jgi:hypothetical protein
MNRSSVRLPDGRLLEFEQELLEFHSDLPEPDPDWASTDHHGHQHHYDKDALAAGRHYYPTLEWVIDETFWCDDCGDEHTEGHWQCPLCGEAVTPGLRGPSLFPRYQAGQRSYYLDGEPITEQQVQALAAEHLSG